MTSNLFEKHAEERCGVTLRYRLMQPSGSGTAGPPPLILFLHGAGERGVDNERQLVHGGAVFAAAEFRRRYPCRVLAPQCPAGDYWVRADWRRGENRQPAVLMPHLAAAMEVIRGMIEAGEVDASRVYVMGLSMGGFGTWDLAMRFPGFFAAAVPICGGGDPGRAEVLRDLPIWAFHGAADDVVPVEYSRGMVRAIEAAGGALRYTEYPAVGHDSWTPAFAEPELFPWMFAHSRNANR